MHATCKMGFDSNSGEKSYDKRAGKVKTGLSPQPKQKKKLGSILNFEEYDEDDFHPRAVKGAEKSKGLHQKQNIETKICQSEEVVRYMSCLPTYLERGVNPQEKPFNLGVLDWSLLERWQHNNADIFGRKAEHLPSTSSLDPFLAGIRSQPSETDGMVSGLKGNGTLQKREASKPKDQIRVTDLDFSGRRRTIVPKSTNDPGYQHFAERHQSVSCEGIHNGGAITKACHTDSRSENDCINSIVGGHDKKRDSQVDKSFSKEIRSLNCSSGKQQAIPCTQSASVSPARRKDLEKKNSASKAGNIAKGEFLQMKVDRSDTKVRNPSPTRRFSFGMGRIGKSSNSNFSNIPKQVLEIPPDSKVTSTSACSDYATGGKSNASSRSRSSPLRRLLDPLLKPKGVESRDFARSSERNSSARDKSMKSSSGQTESPALLSVKAAVSIGGPHHTQKKGISSTQALLQVAVKNGLPLFTFTVDHCRDILAATVKEISSKENIGGWVYSFFSFSNMKKKPTQWINQGSKDKSHGFVSNIVAQMKVSDILDSDSTGKGQCGRREFVLSAVSSREADQTADSLPCDELAAVIVKYQERTRREQNQDVQLCKQSRRGLKDQEGFKCGIDDPFSTMVILPGGHHGVPSKGEPSPLIKRWKEGGSCDCGGWDLGCQLRILAGSNHSSQIFNSIKSQSPTLKLYSEEEAERPMFALSPFEDGIFSIEFDSSLKLIQALSIAIAVLHSRTSVFLSSQGKTAAESALFEDGESKILNRSAVEVSAKYASNPPLSPVGRV